MKITLTIKSFVGKNDGLFFEKSFDGEAGSTITSIMEWLITKKANFSGTHDKILEFKVNDKTEITNFVDYDVLVSTVVVKAASFISSAPAPSPTSVASTTRIAPVIGSRVALTPFKLTDPYGSTVDAVSSKVRLHMSTVFPNSLVSHISGRGRSFGQIKIGKIILSLTRVNAKSGDPNDQTIQIPTDWHGSKFLLIYNEFAPETNDKCMSDRYMVYTKTNNMKAGRVPMRIFTKDFMHARVLDYFTAITHMQLSSSNVS